MPCQEKETVVSNADLSSILQNAQKITKQGQKNITQKPARALRTGPPRELGRGFIFRICKSIQADPWLKPLSGEKSLPKARQETAAKPDAEKETNSIDKAPQNHEPEHIIVSSSDEDERPQMSDDQPGKNLFYWNVFYKFITSVIVQWTQNTSQFES